MDQFEQNCGCIFCNQYIPMDHLPGKRFCAITNYGNLKSFPFKKKMPCFHMAAEYWKESELNNPNNK